MTHGQEMIEVTSLDGTNVKITLADWIQVIIDRALQQHKIDCPVETYKKEGIVTTNEIDKDIIVLDKRLDALELKLKIVHWLIVPFYVAAAGWFVHHFFGLFDKAVSL